MDFRTFFKTPPISWIQYIGAGGWEGMGWEVGSQRQIIPRERAIMGSLKHRSSYCKLVRLRQTCQAETVIDRSLILLVALLVPPSNIYPMVDYHEFYWVKK